MLGILIFTMLTALNTPERPMAIECQQLALYLSGCPHYVLGLSDCEIAHRQMCLTLFPAVR
jgi:hypothetical protein